jgi:hypothetical protein
MGETKGGLPGHVVPGMSRITSMLDCLQAFLREGAKKNPAGPGGGGAGRCEWRFL